MDLDLDHAGCISRRLASLSYLAGDGPAVDMCATTFESTTGAESPPLARKPNYGFEKRKKELDRKARKDAKREDRQRREERTEEPAVPQPPAEDPERDDSRDM